MAGQPPPGPYQPYGPYEQGPYGGQAAGPYGNQPAWPGQGQQPPPSYPPSAPPPAAGGWSGYPPGWQEYPQPWQGYAQQPGGYPYAGYPPVRRTPPGPPPTTIKIASITLFVFALVVVPAFPGESVDLTTPIGAVSALIAIVLVAGLFVLLGRKLWAGRLWAAIVTTLLLCPTILWIPGVIARLERDPLIGLLTLAVDVVGVAVVLLLWIPGPSRRHLISRPRPHSY